MDIRDIHVLGILFTDIGNIGILRTLGYWGYEGIGVLMMLGILRISGISRLFGLSRMSGISGISGIL